MAEIILEFPALEHRDLIRRLKQQSLKSIHELNRFINALKKPGSSHPGGPYSKKLNRLYDNYWKLRKADDMITICWLELGGLNKEIADEQTNYPKIP